MVAKKIYQVSLSNGLDHVGKSGLITQVVNNNGNIYVGVDTIGDGCLLKMSDVPKDIETCLMGASIGITMDDAGNSVTRLTLAKGATAKKVEPAPSPTKTGGTRNSPMSIPRRPF